MNRSEAQDFASRWLPAWTGGNAEALADFYSDDCFYADPGIPNGVNGKAELLAYLSKLLAANPDWIWRQTDAIPMEDGFVNKWCAEIPTADGTVVVDGVCLVQFDEHGRIRRNEVYFDRTKLTRRK